MVMNDTLATALSKIDQYEKLGRSECLISHASKTIAAVLGIFKKFGYIKGYDKIKEGKKESFNVILVFNVLHLLEDTEKVIQRINELLKPGGLFISETACMREKKSFLSIFLFFLSKIRVVPYIRFLKFSELESLIVNEKFQIVESRNLDQTSPTYYVVAKKS